MSTRIEPDTRALVEIARIAMTTLETRLYAQWKAAQKHRNPPDGEHLLWAYASDARSSVDQLFGAMALLMQ